jgi:biotin transport system substrate-specific component
MDMEIALPKQTATKRLAFILVSLLGAGFIALCAQIKIPFYPVPFTLHTFAILLLGLTQTPKQAFGSVVAYLLAATAGLPVLNGGLSNSYWILGPSAGYLLAFPCAAYLISFLKTRIHPLLALLCGEVLILTLGFARLVPLFGVSVAWTHGVALFLASDGLKGLAAFGIAKLWKKMR